MIYKYTPDIYCILMFLDQYKKTIHYHLSTNNGNRETIQVFESIMPYNNKFQC